MLVSGTFFVLTPALFVVSQDSLDCFFGNVFVVHYERPHHLRVVRECFDKTLGDVLDPGGMIHFVYVSPRE